MRLLWWCCYMCKFLTSEVVGGRTGCTRTSTVPYYIVDGSNGAPERTRNSRRTGRELRPRSNWRRVWRIHSCPYVYCTYVPASGVRWMPDQWQKSSTMPTLRRNQAAAWAAEAKWLQITVIPYNSSLLVTPSLDAFAGTVFVYCWVGVNLLVCSHCGRFVSFQIGPVGMSHHIIPWLIAICGPSWTVLVIYIALHWNKWHFILL